MTKVLEFLQPSRKTLELFLREANGSWWLCWLPWRFPYSKSEGIDVLTCCLEDALLGVHYTATNQDTWPKTEAESRQYWSSLEKLKQLAEPVPDYVAKVLPAVIFGYTEEYMLSVAVSERLPRIRDQNKRAEIAEALIKDLCQALASGDVCLMIDDGAVWSVDGRLAIYMVEIDVVKQHHYFERK